MFSLFHGHISRMRQRLLKAIKKRYVTYSHLQRRLQKSAV